MSDRRERLRAKLMSLVRICPETGCWVWQGRTSGSPGRGRSGRGHSYPRLDFDGGTMAAHRAMWILEHGPIPPRKQLDHRCRTRLCICPHPGHNEMTTHLRNQRRRAEHARRMRCDDPQDEACPH